jgi:hypothetical protein
MNVQRLETEGPAAQISLIPTANSVTLSTYPYGTPVSWTSCAEEKFPNHTWKQNSCIKLKRNNER